MSEQADDLTAVKLEHLQPLTTSGAQIPLKKLFQMYFYLFSKQILCVDCIKHTFTYGNSALG